MKNKNQVLKKLKNDIIYLFIVLLIGTVRRLPRAWSLLLARMLAFVFYRLLKNERDKIEANLVLIFKNRMSARERADLGKKIFRNIAQNLVDAVLQKRLLAQDADRIMAVHGLQIARTALEKNKGIIFLTAHTGCFEMLSPRFSKMGFPISVLGTKIYDPRINDLIVKNRQAFDVEYIERGDDLRALLKSLREGASFGVLCDLDTRVESRFIDFFGVPAKTPAGPFKLGVKFGIPLIPIFTRRTEQGFQEVTVYPEIAAQGDTGEERMLSAMRQYNQTLEKFIQQDPAQWIWMHERWKSKP